MAAHDPIPAPCSKAEQSNWVNMVAQLKAPFVDGKHSWSHDGVLSPGFVAGHDSGRSVAPVERHRAAASSQELRMLLKRAALWGWLTTWRVRKGGRIRLPRTVAVSAAISDIAACCSLRAQASAHGRSATSLPRHANMAPTRAR